MFYLHSSHVFTKIFRLKMKKYKNSRLCHDNIATVSWRKILLLMYLILGSPLHFYICCVEQKLHLHDVFFLVFTFMVFTPAGGIYSLQVFFFFDGVYFPLVYSTLAVRCGIKSFRGLVHSMLATWHGCLVLEGPERVKAWEQMRREGKKMSLFGSRRVEENAEEVRPTEWGFHRTCKLQ